MPVVPPSGGGRSSPATVQSICVDVMPTCCLTMHQLSATHTLVWIESAGHEMGASMSSWNRTTLVHADRSVVFSMPPRSGNMLIEPKLAVHAHTSPAAFSVRQLMCGGLTSGSNVTPLSCDTNEPAICVPATRSPLARRRNAMRSVSVRTSVNDVPPLVVFQMPFLLTPSSTEIWM